MESKIALTQSLFEKFKSAFSKKDFEASCTLLSQLKVKLTEFQSLPPLFRQTSTAVQELLLASSEGWSLILCSFTLKEDPLSTFCDVLWWPLLGNIFEHAVVLSIMTEDQEAFERHFLQLKPYYSDTRDRIPSSSEEYPIIGLNLLRLLVQNRIAEFHTELELLSPKALENPCIKYAVELEQSFMEGAYNRVLSARQSVPHKTYEYFMDLLAKTVRDEIAGCSEKAYDYLSLLNAKRMLMFSSDQELSTYAEEEHPEWEIRNGCVYFQKVKETLHKEIPSLQLINQTLGYARELERIV